MPAENSCHFHPRGPGDQGIRSCGISLRSSAGRRHPQFAYRRMGAAWLFATAENRGRFHLESLTLADMTR